MPGKSSAKQISHDKIRSSAAKALRCNGIAAMSVHNVMREAGFTVGGFYAHYKSRGEMVEDAFDAAVAERRAVVSELLEGTKDDERLATFLASYLSDEHADDVGCGCPWAAALSDLQRSNGTLRHMATERFERTVSALHPDRRAAIATLTIAFSSLILMRTVTDPALRREIASAAQFAVQRMTSNAPGHSGEALTHDDLGGEVRSAVKGDM